MCGIVGYIGHKNAYPILIKGLQRLEYRGYDSSGVALINNNSINVYKKKGKVSELSEFSKNLDINGSIGISHTRWATHGEPNDVNAHPHTTEKGDFTLVHNGIIENYSELKQELIAKGHIFQSQTDTEVLVHLVEECYENGKLSFESAVRCALEKVVGTYGIAVLCTYEPDRIIVARKGSPVVIGVGDGEYFVASDAVPIIEYTKNVVYLNDGDLAILKADELVLKTVKNEVRKAEVQVLELQAEALEKSGYDHFMLKEINEQVKAIQDCMRGRVRADLDEIVLGGLSGVKDRLVGVKRIVIVACGTSWHAGLVGEYLLENIAGISVEVEYASEYRYRNPIINQGDVVIAISQSGETADTLAAIRLAKEKGALVLGICNVVGSTISRETDAGVFTHAGPEIGVASTKAFSTQVLVFAMMALYLGRLNNVVSTDMHKTLRDEILALPAKIEEVLKLTPSIEKIALEFKDATDFLYLGRGVSFPLALEGALKLKEISYIHAEGYPAAEMKHGPIALIDDTLPVVFIAPKDSLYDKTISNLQEVKARKGRIISIVTEGDTHASELSEFVITIPSTHELLSPFLTIVPLQLLAYHIALMRGCNVDQPRNLAKSVTVE